MKLKCTRNVKINTIQYLSILSHSCLKYGLVEMYQLYDFPHIKTPVLLIKLEFCYKGNHLTGMIITC